MAMLVLIYPLNSKVYIVLSFLGRRGMSRSLEMKCYRGTASGDERQLHPRKMNSFSRGYHPPALTAFLSAA